MLGQFGEAFKDAMGEQEIVLALRQIESLAWMGRPGAVKGVVNALIDAMSSAHVNQADTRAEYEKEALQSVKEVMEMS